ncbi:MAG: class I SAM-dependent methyltransferase [Methanomicrobiales archaeon]|nr:class I SAM-dependent methyltransferase [Methanomicrobiales archaeon]
MSGNHKVYSSSHAKSLDGRLRRLLFQPDRFVDRYVRAGDTVLDIGCGPGFFTLAMARKIGDSGLVIAVDIQDEMLDILKKKAQKEGLISRIRLLKAEPQSLGLTEPEHITVAFAFYVVHEVPDIARLMREVFTLLVQGGTFLIVEPKFVVSAAEFEKTILMAISAGFRRVSSPSVFLSRAVLLRKDGAVFHENNK